MDGGAEGAALDQPYSDAPNYSGHLYWNVEDLVEVATHAVRLGWKIGTHAVGDSAVRHVLDAYERVIQANPNMKPGTLVIEHGMLEVHLAETGEENGPRITSSCQCSSCVSKSYARMFRIHRWSVRICNGL